MQVIIIKIESGEGRPLSWCKKDSFDGIAIYAPVIKETTSTLVSWLELTI